MCISITLFNKYVHHNLVLTWNLSCQLPTHALPSGHKGQWSLPQHCPAWARTVHWWWWLCNAWQSLLGCHRDSWHQTHHTLYRTATAMQHDITALCPKYTYNTITNQPQHMYICIQQACLHVEACCTPNQHATLRSFSWHSMHTLSVGYCKPLATLALSAMLLALCVYVQVCMSPSALLLDMRAAPLPLPVHCMLYACTYVCTYVQYTYHHRTAAWVYDNDNLTRMHAGHTQGFTSVESEKWVPTTFPATQAVCDWVVDLRTQHPTLSSKCSKCMVVLPSRNISGFRTQPQFPFWRNLPRLMSISRQLVWKFRATAGSAYEARVGML